MVKKGIQFHFQSQVQRVEASAAGGYRCVMDTGTLDTDLIISAIGRQPLTEPLNLAAAGVVTSPGGAIPVDEYYRTKVPHISAIGDVIDRVQLTPVALAEGMAVA